MRELVRLRPPDVRVAADETYEFAGVYCFGRGLFRGQRKSGSQFAYRDLTRLRTGDLVYPKLMAWEGAFGVVPRDLDGLVVSPEFPVFSIDRERVLPEFLDRFFRSPSVWPLLGDRSTGTNVRRKRLHPSAFLSFAIPLPPLAEQRRIVAYVEAVGAQIQAARELHRQAAEKAQGLVSRTTTALLDDAGWETKPLGEVLAESPRNGLAPKPESDNGGRSMLRINSVSSSPTRFVDLTAAKNVHVADEEAAPFVLQDEDVLIVRYNGDINRVAKPAIFKATIPSRVVFPDKLMRLRPNRTDMLPDFLVFALSTRSVRRQVEELGKTTAGNIGVSGTNVGSLIVPVPPLPEQRRIVAKLDTLQAKVDTLSRLQAETAAELDALLPSVLDECLCTTLP